MDEYRVYISQPAEEDMRDMVSYISTELSAPITALKIIEIIEEALKKLSAMPNIHAKVRDDRLSAMGYRMFVINNYIAFFTINEKEKVVDIERILYGRRDWMRVLRETYS